MAKQKILVVDDEQSILNLVSAYLRPEGYEVYTAADGPSGLKAARAYKPDLVVLDIMLPGMDGIGVLSHLRRESDVYVIMLTAKTEETDKIVGLSVGADDYVTKPFSPRELVARIKAALRRIQSGGTTDRGVLSFNQMAAKLEQTETMRRQLIGDVSHELRTPLTTIKGSMEGFIDGVLPATKSTFLEIYHESDRLQLLVNDLQELSRVEAGAYELNQQPVKVTSLIEATVKRLERQFEGKGVALEIRISTGLPQVMADVDRISQVLLNLVGNALLYTPLSGKVTVSADRSDDDVQIAVSDTGMGIPPEHLPHLFTRFYRVDKSRSRIGGGSGIGLTIAKHLVEAHGGRIWVHSHGAGKGSLFAFTMPASK